MNESLRPSHFFFTSQAVELLATVVGPCHGGPSISFGAPAEDQMLIAALEGGLESSGKAALLSPPLPFLLSLPWMVGWTKGKSRSPRWSIQLRTTTDHALRVTKFIARPLGQTRKEVNKVHFLDSLISQVTLFSDAVINFALKFLAIQKQTEAIKRILPTIIHLRLPPRLRFITEGVHLWHPHLLHRSHGSSFNPGCSVEPQAPCKMLL